MLSATTPAQIRDNPSNDSTAKYHWSFGKSPRFRDPKILYHLILYSNHSVGF